MASQHFNVTGMSCAACSARVEKAVSAVPGVTACAVSLLTNSLSAEGQAAPEAIIAAVREAGYQASPADENSLTAESLDDTETPRIRRRLLGSLLCLAALMYISMGHGMWNWPLPAILERQPVHRCGVLMVLTLAVMIVNRRFFINGLKGIKHGAPNMDTLVAMGSGAAFAWSFGTLIMMLRLNAASHNHNLKMVTELSREMYFESAAMILTLITVGKLLEAYSKGRTTTALKRLISLTPKTATLRRGDKEVTVAYEEVRKGDIFLVRPGESVPVDGVIVSGSSALNEAALTGESLPVDKTAGDTVSAATLNLTGFLECRAVRVGAETSLAQIIKLVSEAAASKAPISRTADQVAAVFVPTAIILSVLTTIGWALLDHPWSFAIARGISVLVISCPCALGLATPVAVMVGSGVGANHGILFKTAAALEAMGQIQIVALDKTGTITAGNPQVTGVYPAEGVEEEELLRWAGALESKSEHPLAKAVCAGAAALEKPECHDAEAVIGRGIRGCCEGRELRGGNASYIEELTEIPDDLQKQARAAAAQGETQLWFSLDNKLLGFISAADVIKDDSAQAIAELRDLGVRTVMVTGDSEAAAQAIAAQAGVDAAAAEVRPAGKEAVVRALQKLGKTAMVGDGINDAPALTRADVGVAIGAGTDVAIDAADVVLTKSRLSDVPAAIRLSRATLKNIKENLFWAFFYNTVGIPLAMGLFIPFLGWKLSPTYGAAAMSLSSFCVVSNALRLNLCRPYDSRRDRRLSNEVKSASLEPALWKDLAGMQTAGSGENRHPAGPKLTLTIEGMMCSHCEATVKEIMEGFPELRNVQVSHEQGTATAEIHGDIDTEELKRLIEDEDYAVTKVEIV